MTVLEYFEQQEATTRDLLYELHSLLLAAMPEAKVSIKWKVPFYTLKGDVCYLSTHSKDGIVLGLVKGHRFTQTQHLVTGQDKKIVRHLLYDNSKDVDVESFIAVIEEAISLDSANPWSAKVQ